MEASELIKDIQKIIDVNQHDFTIIGNLEGCPLTYVGLHIDKPYELSLDFV